MKAPQVFYLVPFQQHACRFCRLCGGGRRRWPQGLRRGGQAAALQRDVTCLRIGIPEQAQLHSKAGRHVARNGSVPGSATVGFQGGVDGYAALVDELAIQRRIGWTVFVLFSRRFVMRQGRKRAATPSARWAARCQWVAPPLGYYLIHPSIRTSKHKNITSKLVW